MYLCYGWMRQMVVMAMAYDHHVNDRKVFDATWWWCVAFRAYVGKWTAAFFEYRIKKNAQATGVFDIIARMSEPCCS